MQFSKRARQLASGFSRTRTPRRLCRGDISGCIQFPSKLNLAGHSTHSSTGRNVSVRLYIIKPMCISFFEKYTLSAACACSAACDRRLFSFPPRLIFLSCRLNSETLFSNSQSKFGTNSKNQSSSVQLFLAVFVFSRRRWCIFRCTGPKQRRSGAGC